MIFWESRGIIQIVEKIPDEKYYFIVEKSIFKNKTNPIFWTIFSPRPPEIQKSWKIKTASSTVIGMAFEFNLLFNTRWCSLSIHHRKCHKESVWSTQVNQTTVVSPSPSAPTHTRIFTSGARTYTCDQCLLLTLPTLQSRKRYCNSMFTPLQYQ